MNIIYFDNAATTKIRRDVLDEMMPYLTTGYGNASSLYSIGRQSKRAIDNQSFPFIDYFCHKQN